MTEPTPRKFSKELSARFFAVIERADELGGDLRDYLVDRWEKDPRFARVREGVARLRGQAPAATPAAAAKPAATPAAAAPATATAPAAPIGLGNPALPAQIYGKESCAWTGRARTVLEKNKVDFDYIDLEQPEHEKLIPALATETKQHTVPYVFLRGKFIGGYNALAEVQRLGQLEVALMSAEERAKAPAHLRSIEITPRPNTDEVAPAEVMDAPPAPEA